MIKKLVLSLVFAALGASAAGVYTVAPDQLKQLEADQKTVERAYRRFLTAQQDMQAAQAKMMGDAERIKQANGWPTDAVFRPDTLTFYPPPPATPAPDVPGRGSPTPRVIPEPK